MAEEDVASVEPEYEKDALTETTSGCFGFFCFSIFISLGVIWSILLLFK